jgi:5-methylcytosine-specific restriction endonuclease McrA
MKEGLANAIKTGMENAVRKLHLDKRGTCSVENCSADALAKGFCNAHYIRFRKGMEMSKPLQARTEACIDCGESLNRKGGWMRCSKHFKIARQRTIKEALVDAMGGCCQHCKGVFDLAAYDFHHIEHKDNDPSYLIGNSSVQKIAEELEKCVLLCANCHRIEHASKF